MHKIRHCFHFIHIFFQRVLEEDCTARAGALTYTSLLALVPLMVVSFRIVTALPIFHDWTADLENFIFSNFVPAAGNTVQQYLQDFASHAQQMSMIGLIVLIVTAVLLLFTIEQTFNLIWHVPQRRRGFGKFFIYWAGLTLLPLFVGVTLTLSSYVLSFSVVQNLVQQLHITDYFLLVMPFLFTIVIFTAMYLVIPNCKVPFRDGLIGGVFAAILFEIAKNAFAMYVQHFASYQIIYGALAVVPVFLVWMYVSWLIVLMGAVLTHILTLKQYREKSGTLDPFTTAIHWLYQFWQAQQTGLVVNIADLLAEEKRNYNVQVREMIAVLTGAGLIIPIKQHEYVLSRDLSTLTLFELQQFLPWKLPTPAQLQDVVAPWQPAWLDMVQRAETELSLLFAQPVTRIFENLTNTSKP